MNQNKQHTPPSSNQKNKYSSNEELFNNLNFKYDDFDPKNEKYHPKFHKQREYIEIEEVELLDQNRYRYIVNNTSTIFNNFTHYKHSSFPNITWNDIKIVFYYCIDIYQCPICLENSVTCPMLTACGHIFCWPCLKSFNEYFVSNHKKPKCPLCNKTIDLSKYPAKFCEIINCTNYSTSESNKIEFNLVMRHKKSPNIYNINYDIDLSIWKNEGNKNTFKIPLETDMKYSFSRLFYSNDTLMKKRYLRYKKDLEDALKDEESFYNDEHAKSVINLCIHEISQQINNITDTDTDTATDAIDQALPETEQQQSQPELNINYNDYYFIYQEQYGDIYFLHPLIYNMLMTEYGTVEELPTRIHGTIVDIEMKQITYNLKTKYPYLNHLMIGSIVFFVEIDARQLVSFHTKKKFTKELNERQRIRNLLHKEEKNYELFLKKKVSEEQKQMITEYAKYNQVFHSEPQVECENEQHNETNNNETQGEEKEVEVTESALKKLLNEELVPKKKEVMIKNDCVFEEEEFPTIDKVCTENKNIMKKKGGKKKGNKNKFTEINMDILEHVGKEVNNNDSNSNENSNNNNGNNKTNKNVSSVDVIVAKANSSTAKKQQLSNMK